MSKKSIRFYNNREVRAVWDEANAKWWFSATDIVCAINDEDDYTKCRNYWKYLKGKMANDGIQLVSVTNHFKFQATDGKQRTADALDAECVQYSYLAGLAVQEAVRRMRGLEQDRQERLFASHEEKCHQPCGHQETASWRADRPHCRLRNLHEGH